MLGEVNDDVTVVLIVEDDRDDFFLTEDVLKQAPNSRYSVVWAGSYERALKELLERPYDVALVDYRIGERTGLEFIRENVRKFPTTPMILLTGLADPDIDRAAEEAGAADFLDKGSLTVELLDRSIRYACQNARRIALMDAVLANSAAGIVSLDRAGTPLLWNNQAVQALAVEPSGGDGIVAADVRRALETVSVKGQLPEQFVARNGATYETSLGEVPGGGRVIVLHDVSHRIKAEEMLRQAVVEAEAANMAKSNFLATMSHELRTPMNGILGMARVLETTPLDEEQLAHVGTIRNSGESLLGIINDILDLSKIEAGRMEVECVDLEIRTIIEDVVALMAPTAFEKGVDLVSYVDPRLPKAMRGDPLRIRQVITNLVGNAIKFTERGGITIWVEGVERGNGRRLALSVIDTGIGIPEEKRERLFRRFSQIDASTTRTHGGTGLGLALCREFVTLMDGTIECTSTPGGGSTFTITLPTHAANGAVETAARARANQLAGMSVLLLGEEVPLGRALEAYVTSCGGSFARVDSEAEAIATLDRSRFSALVVDRLVLDQVSPELARRLSLDRPGPGPQLIAVLDSTLDDGRIRLPPDRILARPFGCQSFERICLALRQRPAGPARVVARGVEARQHSLRVLLAEDNEPNQRVAAAMLKSAGFAIDIAANGAKVLERVKAQTYDVVLMDVHMPIMDGLETTRRLRESAEGRVLPVIGLTASVMSGDRQRCLEAGMNDHLPKPIDWDKLIALLRRLDAEIHGQETLARTA